MSCIKHIFDFQKEFDLKHGWHWSPNDEEKQRLTNLQYGVIAISGEVGEFANLVKKLLREYNHANTKPTEEMMARMREELADIFIYLVKLSMLLNMDLEKEYYKKVNRNEKRFKRFVK